ncbi:vesicle-associated membrane protein 7-like isoform X2 [Cydia pomonella]|uniref:vesicle-associated membrane protein 7-like isoform X2 n=1 Tax=Cydia pomonella TaxID=82600 RepID=UPI002ADE6E8B|nr:vesicle-associated membrane protein 7-like isoform X2 [Cydia pomonella]
MPILFSAVALENVVLSRFACCEGNFTEIANEVLSKISLQNGKCTYFHGPYLFNYIAENGHLYFCITDKTCQRSKAFLFLNQIKRRFKSEGQADMQMLADEMYRYSEDHNTIVIHKGELDELNTICVRSSEILGEKLLLVEDVKNLNYGTITYLDKTPEQAMISNSIEVAGKKPTFITNLETKTMTEPGVRITGSEIIYSNDKIKPNMRIVIAMILLGLAVYICDFKPIGHILVLVLFVIFVMFNR